MTSEERDSHSSWSRGSSYGWALLIAIPVALGGIWLGMPWSRGDAGSGVMSIKTKAPALASETRAGNDQIAAPAPASFSASPEVLAALRLPAGSVFRGTASYDADDGVVCGEVSSSQGDRSFRRFVYIASARTGFVDDGGQIFRQINATSCVMRRG